MRQDDAVGIDSVARHVGSCLNQKLIYLKSGTFEVPVPEGRFDAIIHLGDMVYSHEQMSVTIEGVMHQLPDIVGGQVIPLLYEDIHVSDEVFWNGIATLDRSNDEYLHHVYISWKNGLDDIRCRDHHRRTIGSFDIALPHNDFVRLEAHIINEQTAG